MKFPRIPPAGAPGNLVPALAALLLSSCSSLLYYPTRELHFPPEKYGLHPEELSIPSSDGTRLFAWRFRAQAGPVRPKAAILFYHGNGENLSSHYLSLTWILRKGYDFMIFDYRGYGRSEGKPSPEGTVRDGEAALRWMARNYPGTPIVIYAQSLGGAVALRNAIELRKEIPLHGIAIDSSFVSYREVGRKLLARGLLTWPFQWLAWLALSDRFAPDGRLSELSPVPLWVLHAENDEVVPFSCGEKLFAQAAEPKRLVKVPGAGHTDAFLRHGDIYQLQFLHWLEGITRRR